MNPTRTSETLARAETDQELNPCFIKESVPILREGMDKYTVVSKETDNDVVAIYTRQLKGLTLLSAETEKRLCEEIKQNEKEIEDSISNWFDLIENQLKLRSNPVVIKHGLHNKSSINYSFSDGGSYRLKGVLLRFEKVQALKKELKSIRSALSKSREKIPNLADWRETKERGEIEISKLISQIKLDNEKMQKTLHQVEMEVTEEGKKINSWRKNIKNLEAVLNNINDNLQWIRKAKNKLIKSNLFLVIHMAKKYRNRGMDLPDLIQEGNQGLIRAVDTFDHRRGNRFISYAIWWIKQAIIRAIQNQSRTMRVPIYVFDKQKHYLDAAKKVSQEKGREPTLKELASEMKVSIDHVVEIKHVFKVPLHLEDFSLFQEEMKWGSCNCESVSGLINKSDLKEKVDSVLDVLSPREREVIKLRFGINGKHCEHSLQEIGRKFSLSRERIRQIEKSALIKLRGMENIKELRDFLN